MKQIKSEYNNSSINHTIKKKEETMIREFKKLYRQWNKESPPNERFKEKIKSTLWRCFKIEGYYNSKNIFENEWHDFNKLSSNKFTFMVNLDSKEKFVVNIPLRKAKLNRKAKKVENVNYDADKKNFPVENITIGFLKNTFSYDNLCSMKEDKVLYENDKNVEYIFDNKSSKKGYFVKIKPINQKTLNDRFQTWLLKNDLYDIYEGSIEKTLKHLLPSTRLAWNLKKLEIIQHQSRKFINKNCYNRDKDE